MESVIEETKSAQTIAVQEMRQKCEKGHRLEMKEKDSQLVMLRQKGDIA